MFVLVTCLLPFLVTKGSRGLEKKVNETHLLKTVFGHLNPLVHRTRLSDENRAHRKE